MTTVNKPKAKTRLPKITARDVMDYMAPEYGPAEWYSRYTPAEELVYTILSQHTSDLNSERAPGDVTSWQPRAQRPT